MRHKILTLATVISLTGAVGVVSYVAAKGGHGGAGPKVVSRLRPATTTRTVPRAAPRIEGPSYRFTTVAPAGSLTAQISAINDAGAYTGNVVDSSGNRPFLVARSGASPLYFTLPFAAVTSTVETAGIDTVGGVVGNYADGRGVFHGFVRSATGHFKALDIAGAGTTRGEGTEIAGMSPGGVIVGSYTNPSKVATGFVDRNGRVTTFDEPSAGHQLGEGTAVEWYWSISRYGGVYIDSSRAAHGWYVESGKLHTVDDPAAGKRAPHKGTQLVGIDRHGRLYGLEVPVLGKTRAFSMLGGTFVPISDPLQTAGPTGQTLVLGGNPDGVIVGSYTYDAQGRTRAFIARPRD